MNPAFCPNCGESLSENSPIWHDDMTHITCCTSCAVSYLNPKGSSEDKALVNEIFKRAGKVMSVYRQWINYFQDPYFSVSGNGGRSLTIHIDGKVVNYVWTQYPLNLDTSAQ